MRIVLIYSKKEPKSNKKRNDISVKCVELQNAYPNYTIIVGYLIGVDTSTTNDIIISNMTFKIMVGETLLKQILPYDSILKTYKSEVDELFTRS